ncbi:MAG: MmgE/PrpD family protein, partial [Gammaproteobacteria bacterium]|nr:MmgE/PrpD family protein [Gammaproteobacteria bacterium]
KLVILDSLICGIAAGGLERSRMMQDVVRGLGGPAEASVFGMPERVPAAHAAMANAEIMNLLDADDTFFTSSHFAAFNLAGALAEAQRLGRSGQDLILGVTVGFDINARLNLASVVLGEAADGSFQWARVNGMGFAAFGTAASAAAVRGTLSREQLRNMFGLAAWTAPTPVVNKVSTRLEHFSFKYANYPGTAQAGMMALMLAERGYVGDQECLDGEGFIRAQGSLSTDHELMVEELGQKWWILETCIKYYPSCRYTAGPIDMLRRLMQKERLKAQDLERIEIRMHPMGYALRIFREPPRSIAPDHRAPLNGAFNIPYVMALAALGRAPGPQWYSKENLTDPEVWQLASRIVTSEDESARGDVVRAFRQTRIRRFRKTPASMRVWARGREFSCESEYADGDPWSPETKATWERVQQKLESFCSDLLSRAQMDTLVEQVRGLERIEDVSRGLTLA